MKHKHGEMQKLQIPSMILIITSWESFGQRWADAGRASSQLRVLHCTEGINTPACPHSTKVLGQATQHSRNVRRTYMYQHIN
jgi:hypothetical protein